MGTSRDFLFWKLSTFIMTFITLYQWSSRPVCTITEEITGRRRLKDSSSHFDTSCLSKWTVPSLPVADVKITRLSHLDSTLCDVVKNSKECDNLREPLMYNDTFNGHMNVFLEKGRILSIDEIAFGYQQIYEKEAIYSYTNFMGVAHQQDPSDAFAIMDLLWRVKPDLMIELGTTLYFL